jgi:hypothetical protein
MKSFKQGGTLLLLALLALPAQLPAAQSPFDIDLKELDRENPAQPPKAAQKRTPRKTKREAPVPAPAKSGKVQHKAAATAGEAESDSGYIRYTVKPGDHIFKILVARLGMSNEAAERLIPEIIRVNKISNIKTLTVGRTLLIPDKGRQEHLAKSSQPGRARHKREREAEVASVPVPVAAPQAPVVPAPGAKAPVPAPPSVAATKPVTPKVTAPNTATPAPTVSTAARPQAGTPAPAAPATGTAAAKAAASAVEAHAASASSGVVPAAPPVALVNTWICSVTEKDPARIVDAVMNALSLPWSKNRIIQSADGAPNAYSIRVDRYFELDGVRTIVSIGESDPYSYTLLRLLESAGYRVLTINAGDDFKVIGDKMLRAVGVAPEFGRYLITGGKESPGFLVQEEDAAGRRVLITNEAVNSKMKWTMPAGCGIR